MTEYLRLRDEEKMKRKEMRKQWPSSFRKYKRAPRQNATKKFAFKADDNPFPEDKITHLVMSEGRGYVKFTRRVRLSTLEKRYPQITISKATHQNSWWVRESIRRRKAFVLGEDKRYESYEKKM